MSTKDVTGPLVGVKVLDLGNVLAGPQCASFLGDMGAEVIKIEDPGRGDSLRHIGWKHEASPDSLWWKIVARNKKSIAIDLRTADGQDLVRKLAEHADVVVEAFRPGVLESWRLGWEHLSELNPRLIMCRVSGFGQTGPYNRRPGFGTLAEAMSGLAAITGWPGTPPTLPAFGLADGIASISAAFGVVAALYERDSSDRGQVVDVALAEPIMSILGPQLPAWELLHHQQQRAGNRIPFVAPRGAYQCADGEWIALSGATDETAKRLFIAIGRTDLADDPRLAKNQERLRNADLLDDAIAAWAAQHPRAEALRILHAHDVTVAGVYTAKDILADPHFNERQSFVRVDDAELGPFVMPNIIVRHSRTPGAIRHTGRPLDADGGELEAIAERWAQQSTNRSRTP